jgi:hypothetical protein
MLFSIAVEAFARAIEHYSARARGISGLRWFVMQISDVAGQIRLLFAVASSRYKT